MRTVRPVVSGRTWLLSTIVTALAGVGIAWMLATPDGPSPTSVVRVLAVGLGATVFGLTAWQFLQRDERRPALDPGLLWQSTAALAGMWTVAEVVLVVVEAAEAEGRSRFAVAPGTVIDFVRVVNAGRLGVLTVVCVALVTVTAAVAYRRSLPWAAAPVLALSGLALITRPASGHMSQQILGALLGAAHVLAASTWFGMLAALALTVHSRGAWATLLPRYSTIAARCVWVVAATGVVNAAIRLGGVAPLVTTGYGRVVLAKIIALAALLAAGWWLRRVWVVPASAHQMGADASLRWAVVESAAMATALGLAAALATTA
ncbi:CopD family protein [Rhodococcus spongiicola]|uniref:Copper resistance protein CopD n=1 Tax=Rhodococcus spongiicola TaxID=2487352 RepID=A0A438AUF0_9NOCA|nr:CopD family protein [Rhodococcus spongiicola]RVW02289.1 copper resistance protein CopD [Rhodococcus spongiicola]